MVGSEGTINIPFAGAVPVAGKSPQQIEAEVVRRLTGKANQPQVLVRVIRNATSNVTVVGEVTSSTRVPLTARGERLLDALAAAGGVRQPVDKMTLQITRGEQVQAMALDTIIRDPKQNIVLQAGDVVTALFQPLSFTILGATGRNAEINFEAKGITLAQALARAGGLDDNRADARAVFIFRLEDIAALDWATPPKTTPEGKVPVIYQVNLKDPASFFVAQSFSVDNKDVLYVSNAPAAELQKFMNILYSGIYSVSTVRSLGR
jgi:polysaccharide export outer membrane protein